VRWSFSLYNFHRYEQYHLRQKQQSWPMTSPETGRGPLKQCSALGVLLLRSANFHATAIPHTENAVQRELWHRGDKAGGDRGAHAGGRCALKCLCHQEQPRPRACVVAPAGGGHGPVLSTVRRGPPHPVGSCGPCPAWPLGCSCVVAERVRNLGGGSHAPGRRAAQAG